MKTPLLVSAVIVLSSVLFAVVTAKPKESVKVVEKVVEKPIERVIQVPVTTPAPTPSPDWVTPSLPPLDGKTKPVFKMEKAKVTGGVTIKSPTIYSDNSSGGSYYYNGRQYQTQTEVDQARQLDDAKTRAVR